MINDSAANLGIAEMPTGIGLPESIAVAPNRAARRLLLETVLVTTAVILTIALLARTTLAGTLWFLSPACLVAAAIIPAIVREEPFAEIGLSVGRIKQAFPILALTCLIAFSATFAGLWLLKLNGYETPLRVARPADGRVIAWLFYQFLYVAVAEEVFFRGYLQTNIARLASKIPPGPHAWKCSQRLQNCVIVVLCAACFAAAHVIVQGQIAPILTFLPGLILAWLFIRTKSLLAPILFHGLANTFYCIAATSLA
jgi:membrane protease YdiL (CAAX protease family)